MPKKNETGSLPLTDAELYSNEHDLLPRKIEQELARRWRDRLSEEDPRAQRARNRIVQAYQKLSISCAQRASRNGLSFDDLLQEANIGLLQALDRFDPERGFGFGTFARYHVISRLQIYTLENIGPLRIFNTATTKTLLSRYNRLKKEIEGKTGSSLTEDGRMHICGQLGIERDQLERFEMAIASPAPLDAGAGNAADEITRPVQLTADGDSDPEDVVLGRIARRDIRKTLVSAIGDLGDRERRIVLARHMTEPPKTLDALSKDFGISRERVRQIELRALRHLNKTLKELGIEAVKDVLSAG